jgi:diguanylate cyclase (GGDEF)-like protein
MSFLDRYRDAAAARLSNLARRIDPTMRGQTWRRLQSLATALRVHDALTGVLLTRTAFLRRARRRLRPGGGQTVVLFDIDRLKQANDALGHATVDELLIALARTIARIADRQPAARWGGDEFILLVDNEPRARELVDRIRSDVAARFCAERMRTRAFHPNLGDAPLLTLSAGAATHAGGTEPLSWLIRRSDEALSEVKNARSDSVRWG